MSHSMTIRYGEALIYAAAAESPQSSKEGRLDQRFLAF
jgi:hypothetical protein